MDGKKLTYYTKHTLYLKRQLSRIKSFLFKNQILMDNKMVSDLGTYKTALYSILAYRFINEPVQPFRANQMAEQIGFMKRRYFFVCLSELKKRGLIGYINLNRLQPEQKKALIVKANYSFGNYIPGYYNCDWCNIKAPILEKHHYPLSKSNGGKKIVNICPNCHSAYHSINTVLIVKSYDFSEIYRAIIDLKQVNSSIGGDKVAKYKRLFTLNEPSVLRINPALANEIGLNDSILLMQLEYWISISNNVRDGRRWTYQSLRDMKRKAFPFWSKSGINKIISRLEEKGYIVIGDYNKKGYDKTRWFSLNYDKIAELKSVKVGEMQRNRGCTQSGQGVHNVDGGVEEVHSGVEEVVDNTKDYPKNSSKNKDPSIDSLSLVSKQGEGNGSSGEGESHSPPPHIQKLIQEMEADTL